MTARYSKGPFEFDRNKIVDGDGYSIATVNSSGTTEGRANGHLFAASFELVEALRQMIANSSADGKEYRDCHKNAVAVLAKVEGRTDG